MINVRPAPPETGCICEDQHGDTPWCPAPVPADPFASTPDAVREDCEIRGRAWTKPETLCDVASKPKRKKVDLTPMERKWFEREGYVAHRVEVANAWGAVNQDMWGVGDFIAAKPGEGILLVQVTTASNAAARMRKAEKCTELQVWLAAGGRFEIHSWAQPGGPGSRWQMERRTLEDVQGRRKARSGLISGGL